MPDYAKALRLVNEQLMTDGLSVGVYCELLTLKDMLQQRQQEVNQIFRKPIRKPITRKNMTIAEINKEKKDVEAALMSAYVGSAEFFTAVRRRNELQIKIQQAEHPVWSQRQPLPTVKVTNY